MPDLYWQMDVMYDSPTWNYITHRRIDPKLTEKMKKSYPNGMYHHDPTLKPWQTVVGSLWSIFRGMFKHGNKVQDGNASLNGPGLSPNTRDRKLGFIKGLIRQGNAERTMTVVGSTKSEDHDVEVYSAAAKEFPGWIDTAVFIACGGKEETRVRDAFRDLNNVNLYLMCPNKKQMLKGLKDEKGVPYFEPVHG